MSFSISTSSAATMSAHNEIDMTVQETSAIIPESTLPAAAKYPKYCLVLKLREKVEMSPKSKKKARAAARKERDSHKYALKLRTPRDEVDILTTLMSTLDNKVTKKPRKRRGQTPSKKTHKERLAKWKQTRDLDGVGEWMDKDLKPGGKLAPETQVEVGEEIVLIIREELAKKKPVARRRGSGQLRVKKRGFVKNEIRVPEASEVDAAPEVAMTD